MSNYRNFKLTTYFVAHATCRVTREELEKELNFMEKYMRLDKVYLEPWREVFKAHGVEVAGGLTTVIPTPKGDAPKTRLFDTFCYNDPKMRAKLKEVSTFIGARFSEFIIDDFFFTGCACPACVKAKNAFNEKHGITPTTIRKKVRDLIAISKDIAQSEESLEKDPESMSRKELEKLIKDVEKQMRKAAADLNFEMAAQLRDKMISLKQTLVDLDDAG